MEALKVSVRHVTRSDRPMPASQSEVTAMLLAAREHQTAKRWQEAESLLRRILADNPNCAEAWCRLGQIGLEAKQYSIAEQYVRRAIELDSETVEGHCCLGSILMASWKIVSAVGSFCRIGPLRTCKRGAIKAF